LIAAFRAVRRPSSLTALSLADAHPLAGHIEGTWDRELAGNDENERDIISQVRPWISGALQMARDVATLPRRV
jgi:hypothetical protein